MDPKKERKIVSIGLMVLALLFGVVDCYLDGSFDNIAIFCSLITIGIVSSPKEERRSGRDLKPKVKFGIILGLSTLIILGVVTAFSV